MQLLVRQITTKHGFEATEGRKGRRLVPGRSVDRGPTPFTVRILIDQTRLAPPWLGVPRAGRPPKVQEEDEGRSRLGWVLREIGVSSARAEAPAAQHAESTNGTCYGDS